MLPLVFRWSVCIVTTADQLKDYRGPRYRVVPLAPLTFRARAGDAELGGHPSTLPPAFAVFHYPLGYDRLILALHALGLYLHVQMGLYTYSNQTTLAIAWAVTALSVGVNALLYGLRPRMAVIFKVGLPTATGYAVFLFDYALGAMGHNLWHMLVFIAIDTFLHEGPFFTGRNGLHVTLARPSAHAAIVTCPGLPTCLSPSGDSSSDEDILGGGRRRAVQ